MCIGIEFIIFPEIGFFYHEKEIAVSKLKFVKAEILTHRITFQFYPSHRLLYTKSKNSL